MILQNTVDPWSNLHRDKTRVGVLMGNRGGIHDRNREIKQRPWSGKRWICCARSFNGIDRRPLFKTDPFSYSELFFLDEATAYSAGHRPCSDCRRKELDIFKKLWSQAGFSSEVNRAVGVKEIDLQLHTERLDGSGNKLSYSAKLSSLPPGTMFAHDGKAYLTRPKNIRLWTSSGYLQAEVASDAEVDVLTPPSIVRLLAIGLPVQVDASADD